MTTSVSLVTDEGMILNIYVNEDGFGDCSICVDSLRANAGQLVYETGSAARAAGRTAGLEATDETRCGSYGFIHYSASGTAPEDQRVIFWNNERTAYPLRDTDTDDTDDTDTDEPRANEVPAVTLFEAVALANGVGGTVRWSPGGGGAASNWRIISCESHENGVARMTLAEHNTDNGATGFVYGAYARREWRVLTVGTNTPPETPETPEGVIPRTSSEARALRNLVRDITSIDPSAQQTEVLRALDTLVLMLPGGRAEQSGADLARGRSLCDVYERTVCPTLGWAPRPDYGYRTAALRFVDEMVAHERDHAHLGMADNLIAYARRYERGGIVNEAILDSMETNLEGHKRPAANQVLEALGMDTLEERGPSEYEVSVRVTRDRVVRETAYITVTVEADDEDHARDLALDIADSDQWGVDWEADDDEYSADEVDRDVDEVNEV